MRTRAKKKYVASDLRSAKECAKAHSSLCTGKSFYNTKNIKEQMFENDLQNEWNCDMLITEKNKHMFDV